MSMQDRRLYWMRQRDLVEQDMEKASPWLHPTLAGDLETIDRLIAYYDARMRREAREGAEGGSLLGSGVQHVSRR